jgi:hypothetical protein
MMDDEGVWEWLREMTAVGSNRVLAATHKVKTTISLHHN